MSVEITLKKAINIQKALLEAANKIKFNCSIRVMAYGNVDVAGMISENQEKLQEAFSDAIQLLSTHYNIKALAGEANDKCGITNLLREKARFDAIEKKLGSLIKITEVGEDRMYSPHGNAMQVEDKGSIAAILDRIAVIKERIQNKDRIGEDSFNVDIVTDAFMDFQQSELLRFKRQKASVSDQIAALNINNKITIDDSDVSVLRKHKIL
jgi:hypothetical protein